MSGKKPWYRDQQARELLLSVSGLSQRGELLRELLAVIDRMEEEKSAILAAWEDERERFRVEIASAEQKLGDAAVCYAGIVGYWEEALTKLAAAKDREDGILARLDLSTRDEIIDYLAAQKKEADGTNS